MAHEDEPTLVAMARMEGKLDRVMDRVGDLRVGVDRHRVDIEELKSLTQTLEEGAAASKDTALALALALKDAKETQEAIARADLAKSDRSWVPYARAITIMVAVVAVLGLYLQSRPLL